MFRVLKTCPQFPYRLIFLVTVVITWAGCKNTGGLDIALNKVAHDYEVNDVSFLIVKDGKVTDERLGAALDKDSTGIKNVIDNFTAPVFLDALIKEGKIKPDSNIDLLPVVHKSFSVKAHELICLPKNIVLPFPYTQNNTGLIKKLIGVSKKQERAFSIFVRDGLGIGTPYDANSILRNIAQVSLFFDKNYPEYNITDTAVINLFPTIATKNLASFYGWNIFLFAKQTILWNSFKVNGQNILVMKFMNKGIFAAIAYKANKVPQCFDYKKSDLLQSPFAVALIKTVLNQGQPLAIDGSSKEIYNKLKANNDKIGQVLDLNELLSYSRFLARSGNTQRSNELFSIYKKATSATGLGNFINKPVVADISYVADNVDAIVPFEAMEATKFRIFGAGQAFLKTDQDDYPYHYDNVQIFLNKDADPKIAKKSNDKILEFNYRCNKIYEQSPTDEKYRTLKDSGIEFAYSDPTDTTYLLEIKIPLQVLYLPSAKGVKAIPLNLFVGDSDLDEDGRKSVLSWSVNPNTDWNDPNQFGRLVPGNKAGNLNEKNAYPLKHPFTPKIDGVAEAQWDNVPFSDIKTPFIGNPFRADNSACFKAVYDSANLYFMIRVVDNCKNKTGIITKDKCWIEDAQSGQIVWKMQPVYSPLYPTFNVEQQFSLPKGKYNLRYTSDDKHSFEGWYGPRPLYGLYGAKLYKN